MDRPIELDELVEDWTLLEDERVLVTEKRGASQQLGFAMLLKFYGRLGRFPGGLAELPGDAVRFVADQLRQDATSIDSYE